MLMVIIGGGITMGDIFLHFPPSVFYTFLICAYNNFIIETNKFLIEMPHYLNEATTESWRLVTTLLPEIPPCGGPHLLPKVYCVQKNNSPREGGEGYQSQWLLHRLIFGLFPLGTQAQL